MSRTEGFDSDLVGIINREGRKRIGVRTGDSTAIWTVEDERWMAWSETSVSQEASASKVGLSTDCSGWLC